MSRDNILFYMIPTSKHADKVLKDPENRFLVDNFGPGPRFAIGHFQSQCGSRTTLVTIGRAGDITLRGTIYSRIQCSFGIDAKTNVVMFYDDSSTGTSSVLGPDSMPFRPGQPRKIVVQRDLNSTIGMGGVNHDLITFMLDWASNAPRTLTLVQQRAFAKLPQNPRLARTGSDDLETALPTMPLTRIHTWLPNRPMIRWARIDRIGAGAFGRVDRAVDVDSGKLIAVKTIRIRQNQNREAFFNYLKREIEAIGRIEHPFIVKYISYEASIDASEAKVVMGLMKGSLCSLLGSRPGSPGSLDKTAEMILTHMLQALDCVASMDMVHRDVKPENILYSFGPEGEIVFKLGDFGLCNHSALAQSPVGTPLYMAPEVCSGKQKQTPKADIWSLFVVLLWIYDFKGFRTAHFKTFTIQLQQQLVKDAAAPGQRLELFREMARLYPEKRASAAQMMLKLRLFEREPRAILCSHGKDPKRIPQIPPDDFLPVPRRPEQPNGNYSAKPRPSASDVQMGGMTGTYLGGAPR